MKKPDSYGEQDPDVGKCHTLFLTFEEP